MKIHSQLSLISIALVTVSCWKGNQKQRDPDDPWPQYYYDYGEYKLSMKEPDSAYHFFDLALTTTRDSLVKAKSYNGLARMLYDMGDYYGARENLGFSFSLLDPTDRAHDGCFFSNYTTLGNTSINLKNYDEGIRYFHQALAFQHIRDYALNLLNSKAIALQKKGDLTAAALLLDSIFHVDIKDTVIKARVICNRARVMWLADNSFNPLNEYREAVGLRLGLQHIDYAGLTSSYGNLSEYYTQSKIDSALFYAHKMYETAVVLQSADDRMEALLKLSRLSPPVRAVNYYSNYVALGDSLQTVRNKAKNQFAIIRYESEKSKAENLRLHRDLLKQRFILYSTIIAAVFIILFSIFAYRKKRARLRQEVQNEIRENRLKTSQKVHDVVANGLYRIMNDLEHSEEIDKEKILDKVEVLYEQSRDISYEDQERVDTINSQTIGDMLSSFANEKTKVLVTGNSETVSGLNFLARAQLIHIMEELMINMQKHSGAENVVVRFSSEGGMVVIDYKDDGKGFSIHDNFGNGLKSTVNRISSLRGEINFERDPDGGQKVKIKIPGEK